MIISPICIAEDTKKPRLIGQSAGQKQQRPLMMAQCNDETERKAAYDTKSSETRQEICTTTDSDVHTLVMRQSIRIIRYN